MATFRILQTGQQAAAFNRAGGGDSSLKTMGNVGYVEVDVKETAIPLPQGVTECLELTTQSGEKFYIVGEPE